MFELKLENENNNIVDLNDGINYVVRASGLNPPSASIFTSKSPNRKGVKYNGSSLNERNIVLSITLLGDIEKNRNYLYDWIDTEQYVKVRYSNGVKNVYCEGHVQECEFDVFTDREVIDLVIICENPFWKDLQEIETDISNVLNQFTFPFAINNVGIPFSTTRESNTTTIFNAGNETGCIIRLEFNDVCINPKIINANDTTQYMQIVRSCSAGEIIIINTDNSPKSVKLVDINGNTTNILNRVSNDPTWFTLKKGFNSFSFSSDYGVNNAIVTISFTNKYLGV